MDINRVIEFLSKDPDSSKIFISSIVEQYKPLLYAVCAELFGLFKDLVNNDDYYNTNALHYKQMIDSFMSVGFSREEAMDILIMEKRGLQNQASKSVRSIKLNSKD